MTKEELTAIKNNIESAMKLLQIDFNIYISEKETADRVSLFVKLGMALFKLEELERNNVQGNFSKFDT